MTVPSLASKQPPLTNMHARPYMQSGPIVQPLPVERPFVVRVILQAGAKVRQGREMDSAEIETLPRGTLLTISDRAFTAVSQPGERSVVRLKLADRPGWISMRLSLEPPRDEPVVEVVGDALPPTPASVKWMYRIVTDDGAVVREDPELSSAQVRHIPRGAIVEVTGKVTNSRGLSRLRIEDGWISEAFNPSSGKVRT
jgi:hypothetical protein